MSTDTQEPTSMGTQPVAEHAWLQQLVGDWKVTGEMVTDPDGSTQTTTGTESCRSLGGLWAYSEGRLRSSDGSEMTTVATLGYDVSFKEYRGCWFASVSSHLWKQVGTLSEDGKTMTLDCEGPSMTEDGETALYRDVIEIIDSDHRTLTSYGQDEKGEWQRFHRASYTRA